MNRFNDSRRTTINKGSGTRGALWSKIFLLVLLSCKYEGEGEDGVNQRSFRAWRLKSSPTRSDDEYQLLLEVVDKHSSPTRTLLFHQAHRKSDEAFPRVKLWKRRCSLLRHRCEFVSIEMSFDYDLKWKWCYQRRNVWERKNSSMIRDTEMWHLGFLPERMTDERVSRRRRKEKKPELQSNWFHLDVRKSISTHPTRKRVGRRKTSQACDDSSWRWVE